jgi:hypothetical protein
MERTGIQPCGPWHLADAPGMVTTEVAVHRAALDRDAKEVAAWLNDCLTTTAAP